MDLKIAIALTAAAIMPLALASGANASSPDAWEAFRTEVKAECEAVLATKMPSAKIEEIRIDPFGSQSFGFALITLVQTNPNDAKTIVCVYDKAEKRTEISEPL